jgi:hypothetical protein
MREAMTLVVHAPGVMACSFTDTDTISSPNGRHHWDFSWRFGPLFTRKNGEPLKNQPQPGSAAWSAFETWFAEWKKTHYAPLV